MRNLRKKSLVGVLMALFITLMLPLSAKADNDRNFIYVQLVDESGNPVDNVSWGGHKTELVLSEVTPGSGIYYNYLYIYSNDAWATCTTRFVLYDNVTLTDDYTYDKSNATVIGSSSDEPLEVVDKFLRYKADAGSTKPFVTRPLGDCPRVYYNKNTGRLVIDDFSGQFIAKSSFTTDASYEDDLTELSAKKFSYLSQVDIPAGAFDITLKPQLYWCDNANDYNLSFDTDGFALNYPDYHPRNSYLHLTCDNWEGGHILSYGSYYNSSNEPTSISFCRIESLDKLYLDLQASDCTGTPDDAEIAAWDTFLNPDADQLGVYKTATPVSCEKFAIYLNLGSKYGLSNGSYAARIYDLGYNDYRGFTVNWANTVDVISFIRPINSRNELHWMSYDGSAVNSEFTVDLINQKVTVYADPEQYGFEDSYRFREDAIYLIGLPQGWDINNGAMKLVKTDYSTYTGTFYINPGEFDFRFYTELGSWDNGSLGADGFGMDWYNGVYSGEVIVGGMGQWVSDWDGGYVRCEVSLSKWSHRVTFTKVDQAEEWTAMNSSFELPATVSVLGSLANQQSESGSSDSLAGDGTGKYTGTFELPAGAYDVMFADYVEGTDAPYYYGANYDGRPALDNSDATAFVSTRKSINEPHSWALTLDKKARIEITLNVNKNCVTFKKTDLEEGGISAPFSDEVELPAEYYDLRGIRIANPTVPGIYIKRCGSNATKVVVK
jgi:hypothetical protein